MTRCSSHTDVHLQSPLYALNPDLQEIDSRSTTATTSPQPPWKRAKRPFQSQQEATAAYWDSLSKLCLTRRAVEEFNRRNKRAARPSRTSAGRPELNGDCTTLKASNQIKCFARQGGPDLRDLRGYPEPRKANSIVQAMPPSQSTARSKSKSPNNPDESTVRTSHKKSSAYNRDFEQHLVDHRIYPSHYDFPNDRDSQRPENEDDILARLAQPRPSLSPSRFSSKAFDRFVRTNSRALNEPMVMRSLFPTISGDSDIPSAGELPFENLEPLTDGTLVDAKPGLYDGARPAQIHRRIREELGSYITPSTQQQAPALPNFFTEAKGPDGSTAVAKRQACYDGALGARGIHKLRSFRIEDSEALYDNNAYTITSTYQGNSLAIYTTHITHSPDNETSAEYHMTQLRIFSMTDTAERFREGASAFRNARDWAKEKRDQLITTANGKMIRTPSRLAQSTNELLALESETSVDDLAPDEETGATESKQGLKRRPEERFSESEPKRRRRNSWS